MKKKTMVSIVASSLPDRADGLAPSSSNGWADRRANTSTEVVHAPAMKQDRQQMKQALP